MWHKKYLHCYHGEKVNTPSLPSRRFYSLCCFPMEVTFVHRATALTGRPAPCTLPKLLKTLGSVVTWTQEQPKGAEMGTGGGKILGKTPWPSWPCKAVGSVTEHQLTWLDAGNTFPALHICWIGIPIELIYLPARPLLVFFFLMGRSHLYKKRHFFPLHIINIVWKADFWVSSGDFYPGPAQPWHRGHKI